MIRIDRVKNILLTPKTEWPVIDGEPATIGSIVKDYLIWLALIPAIATFIGMSLIGFGGFGMRMRIGIGSGIAQALVGIVLTLLGAWVLSLIVNWLAPRFGGTANPLAAFKLVAYGATAALVAGVFSLIPWLGILGLVGALYSIYLIYLGLPVLMKCPADKSVLYTLVVIVCGFIANLLIGWVASIFVPGAMMRGGADMTLSTPRGDIALNQGKLEEMGKRMEEVGKRFEEAAKTGDPKAAKAARDAVSQMAAGTGGRTPLEPARLKALLPESLAGMKRGSFEAESRSVMGLTMSNARAQYGEGERTLRLEITDSGSAAGLLSGLAGWANVLVDRETDTAIEKTYRDGDRVISLHADKDGGRAEYKLLLPNGIVIEAKGRGVPLEALTDVVGKLEIGELAAAH